MMLKYLHRTTNNLVDEVVLINDVTGEVRHLMLHTETIQDYIDKKPVTDPVLLDQLSKKPEVKGKPYRYYMSNVKDLRGECVTGYIKHITRNRGFQKVEL